MESIERIDRAADYVLSKTSTKPTVGLVLGSGLGHYAEQLKGDIVSYSEIPGFPQTTVMGHAGTLTCGQLHGKPMVMMSGRFHAYEGHPLEDVVLPVRMMRRMGVQTIIITNAAGGINPAFSPGDLMLITDHINFSGHNPLTGQNINELGTRFPDMSTTYSKLLRGLAYQCANDMKFTLHEGVYAMMNGPSFETPAEIRMLRTLGADAVGMSTVPEAIASRHAGMEVLGISCITNMAAGILDQPLSHMEVMETSERTKTTFTTFLDMLISKMWVPVHKYSR